MTNNIGCIKPTKKKLEQIVADCRDNKPDQSMLVWNVLCCPIYKGIQVDNECCYLNRKTTVLSKDKNEFYLCEKPRY